MQPYPDPIWDEFDALERSIEQSFEPAFDFHINPDEFMDGLARDLTALEDSIEGSQVGSPIQPEPPVLSPEPFGPRSLGPTSAGPPSPPESDEKPWITLQPPPEARPYFLPDGLVPPSSYRTHGHAGTGIRNTGESEATRICPASGQPVDEDTCQSCRYWQEDDAGGHCNYQVEEGQDESNDEGREDEE